MKITLTPRSQAKPLVASIAGDTLSLNGMSLDLTPLAEGDTLPETAVDTDWLAGPISRQNGVVHITLILPHGPHAPHATRFPDPLDAEDGPLTLPDYDLGGTPAPQMGTGEIKVDWALRVTAPDRTKAERATQRATARAYLRDTDWYVTRQAETGAKIPDKVAENRRVARDTANIT